MKSLQPTANLRRGLFARSFLGRPWSIGPREALAVLIFVVLVLRLGWSAVMEVGNDEAYHYLFTVHPDWSFFDHPPMTMWIEWLGIKLCGGWVHPFSLRLGFVLMFAGSTWFLARLTARWYGEWAGFYAAFFLNVTFYYGGSGGFVLPDPPLLFFGLLTIWSLNEALVAQPGRTRPWVWVGLAFGGALLSKYHAILFPAGALLYIVLTPGTRHLLRRPGPYLAVVIGFACFTPVLIWNSQHHWASFLFQGNRATGAKFQVQGVLITLFGPIGCLLPWIWFLLVNALFGGLRRFRSLGGSDRLLVCMAIVPLSFFLGISLINKMLMHWSLIGYVPLFPLAAAQWARRAAVDPVGTRKWAVFMTAFVLIVSALSVAQVRTGMLKFPFKDPFIEMSGWESVGDELRARGLTKQPKTFIFTSCWYDSGQAAFAIRNEIPVLCYQTDSRGFAYWSHPNDWIGWDGLYITTQEHPWELDFFWVYFKHMEMVATFPMTRGGVPFRTVWVWRCTEQHTPFPFRREGQ